MPAKTESERVMICTGEAEVNSSRRMREPVTTMLSTSVGSVFFASSFFAASVDCADATAGVIAMVAATRPAIMDEPSNTFLSIIWSKSPAALERAPAALSQAKAVQAEGYQSAMIDPNKRVAGGNRLCNFLPGFAARRYNIATLWSWAPQQ
ncbi:MAG: hypothetical protein QM608_11555 [Caulobacter sp.]